MAVLHQVSTNMVISGTGAFEKAFGNLYGAGFADRDGTDDKSTGSDDDILE